jgi:hypothetical protein
VVESISDDSTNVWPDEAAEAAFLSESRDGSGSAAPAAAPKTVTADEDDSIKALPALDELVNRIPAETRELLDELFRAKFTTVRRVKKSDLKPRP